MAKKPSLAKKNLSHVNLATEDLTGADLHEAALHHATLKETKLDEADLTAADLAHANLAGASLRDATAAHANLEEANLRGARLVGAKLDEAQRVAAAAAGADLANEDGEPDHPGDEHHASARRQQRLPTRGQEALALVDAALTHLEQTRSALAQIAHEGETGNRVAGIEHGCRAWRRGCNRCGRPWPPRRIRPREAAGWRSSHAPALLPRGSKFLRLPSSVLCVLVYCL
jgi:hypothetical protein